MRNKKLLSHRILFGFLLGVAPLTVGANTPDKKPSPVLKQAEQKKDGKTSSFHIGARFSSLGILGEIGYRFNPTFGIRIHGGGYDHFHKEIKYNGETYHHIRYRPLTIHFLADWYFLKDWWRLTGGIGYNWTHMRLKKDKRNDPFPQNLIGVVTNRFKYKRKVTPYVGTGFDFPPLFGSKFIISIDAGVNFQGKVKARTSAKGGFLSNYPPALKTAKHRAEKLLNDPWWIRYYPVISVGVRYCF